MEKRALEVDAAKILEVDSSYCDGRWGRAVGYGARSIALIQPDLGGPKRFSNRHGHQVLVKLFKLEWKAGECGRLHSLPRPIV